MENLTNSLIALISFLIVILIIIGECILYSVLSALEISMFLYWGQLVVGVMNE